MSGIQSERLTLQKARTKWKLRKKGTQYKKIFALLNTFKKKLRNLFKIKLKMKNFSRLEV